MLNVDRLPVNQFLLLRMKKTRITHRVRTRTAPTTPPVMAAIFILETEIYKKITCLSSQYKTELANRVANALV